MKKLYVWINENGIPEGSPQTRMVEPPPKGWVEWQETEIDPESLLIYEPQYFPDEGVARLVAVFDLGAAREEKTERIKREYEEVVHAGFEVNGKRYASSKEAQIQIQLAVSMGTASPVIMDDDHGTCSMVDADELKAIGAAMLKHLSNCIQRRSTAVAAINDATSVEDLDKVVF